VVRFGGRTVICNISVRTEVYVVFRHLEVLRLEMSICQQNDPAFSTFLDSIGDDYEHETGELGRLHHTRSVQELIDFVFPPAIVSDPCSELRNSGILASLDLCTSSMESLLR
jgi:hypothetical protein